ncbi:MAG: hypothetical protein AAF358_12805 [Pseudomonadota bacterium]
MSRSAALTRGKPIFWTFLLGAALMSAVQVTAGAESPPPPSLKDNQGYLLLSTDLNFDAVDIELKRDGGLFHRGLDDLKKGVSHRLIALDAGRYYFRNLTVGIWGRAYKISLGEDTTAFEIEPGKINYMGQLVARHVSGTRFFVRRTNRLTQVLTWLPENHPTQYRNYELRFAGPYPDPFLALVKSLESQKAVATEGD